RELELLLKQLRDIPSTGVIVLDSELRPVYSNLKMLEFDTLLGGPGNYGGQPGNYSRLPEQVKTECRAMIENVRISTQPLLQNRHVAVYQNQRQKVDVEIMTLPLETPPARRFNQFYLLLIFSKSTSSSSQGASKIKGDFTLTPREKEIADCLCQGLSNKEISRKLFVSLPTVATHVQNILHKTGISRRSQFISHFLS
ncbi:MAG TPA: helix-turn-helix transcriptional regulator, partial [Dehalococcoidales bacterium]|nr:helix-turn-helix transcriptional regulator [Dehalococcoidales bacterium]